MLDSLTRGWAIVTAAGVARLGLGFVASIVVARALGPEDYGVYAVLAATVGIVGAVAEGGLSEAAVQRMASVRATAADCARERGRQFFWLRLGLAALVIAVACGVAGPASGWVLRLPDDGGLLRWALLGVVATALSGAVAAMLQAIGWFGRMSAITLANAALTSVLALGLAAVGQLNLLTALVVLGIGTSLASFAVGVWLLPPAWRPRGPRLADLRAEAGPLLRTGRWLWLASLCAMLTANLDVLLLNHWSPLAGVGAYALAVSLATKADVVNHSLYTVLLPAASSLGGGRDVGGYLRRGLVRSALICVPLLALGVVADPLIVFFYGAEFAPAVGLFRLLLGVVACDVVLTPMLLLPLTYQRPQVMAAADALRATTLGVVGAGLIPGYGPVGAVSARLAAKLAGAALVLLALQRVATRESWVVRQDS